MFLKLFFLSYRTPESWSSGTLATLGDFLFVFDEEDFETISASARSEAADVLAKHTTLHHSVEWSGKLYPISYYEVSTSSSSSTDISVGVKHLGNFKPFTEVR